MNLGYITSGAVVIAALVGASLGIRRFNTGKKLIFAAFGIAACMTLLVYLVPNELNIMLLELVNTVNFGYVSLALAIVGFAGAVLGIRRFNARKKLILAALGFANGIALVVYLRSQPPENAPFEAHLAHTGARIDIQTPNGWWLKIFSHGSGELCYGSGGPYTADIPEGTFSFRSIRAALHSELGGRHASMHKISVFFPGEHWDKPGAPGCSLTDKELVRKLFAEAVEKCIPMEKEYFDDVLKKNPPSFEDNR